MGQHLRDIWRPGVGILSLVLGVLSLVLIGPRELFIALAAIFAVWLAIEVSVVSGRLSRQRGRDVLFAALGAALALCLFVAISWNALATSPDDSEPAATRAAGNEVFYELLKDDAILREVAPRKASPIDAYEQLGREAFARERHVLAAALLFDDYQLIENFYEYASYPVSWVLGPRAEEHIDRLHEAVKEAEDAIFPYVHQAAD
jgi:hypothetical protein